MATTEQAADVTGLLLHAGEAFASGVPSQPADDGYFGPRSVTWRISNDLSGIVAGPRSLIIQALHPLAMAGVDQHSHWRTDPVGRLAGTAAFLSAISFGDRAMADRAAARVRKIHEYVSGVDEITGQPYRASDPELLLWVHAVQVDSALAARAMFGMPLSAAVADRYVAEMVTAAELVGVPREQVPSDVASLSAYLDSVRPRLLCTPVARESIAHVLELPELDSDVADFWQDIKEGVIASLPEWVIRLYGQTPPPPVSPQRRTEIRQALGVMDMVFLAAPGALEARQRITLRIRAAEGV